MSLKYPLRTCRWVDKCRLCNEKIISGEKYYDGGYGRRFHKRCVDASEAFLNTIQNMKKKQ